MAVIIEICFKSLLAKITEALQFTTIMYTQNPGLQYSYYVKVNTGPQVINFEETQQHSIGDSE